MVGQFLTYRSNPVRPARRNVPVEPCSTRSPYVPVEPRSTRSPYVPVEPRSTRSPYVPVEPCSTSSPNGVRRYGLHRRRSRCRNVPVEPCSTSSPNGVRRYVLHRRLGRRSSINHRSRHMPHFPHHIAVDDAQVVKMCVVVIAEHRRVFRHTDDINGWNP